MKSVQLHYVKIELQTLRESTAIEDYPLGQYQCLAWIGQEL